MPNSEDLALGTPPAGAPRTAPAQSPMNPSWLRLAYSVEFLIALIAAFTLWSQVGGQGHLDMMPWYVKLGCAVIMAWCAIRLTAGMVEEPKAWNGRTARWFAGLIAVGLVMAGITFYYHLHEASDEPDNDDTTATSVRVVAPLTRFSRTSDRTNR